MVWLGKSSPVPEGRVWLESGACGSGRIQMWVGWQGGRLGPHFLVSVFLG